MPVSKTLIKSFFFPPSTSAKSTCSSKLTGVTRGASVATVCADKVCVGVCVCAVTLYSSRAPGGKSEFLA